MKTHDELSVAIASLLFLGCIFVSKRSQYKEHIRFLQSELDHTKQEREDYTMTIRKKYRAISVARSEAHTKMEEYEKESM